MLTITLKAGAKIKKGQMLYSETTDQDTSDSLTLVYPYVEGKAWAGVALNDAQSWEDVVVMVQGSISGTTTTTGIADQKLYAGDAVYMTPDGTLRSSTPEKAQPIIRYVIAGAEVFYGQGLIYDSAAGGYVPTDAEKVEGTAAAYAQKGALLPMVVAFYDEDSDTMHYRPHPDED